MTNAIPVLLAVIMALLLGSCKDDSKQEILDVFDAYQAALENKDGAAAVALVDEKYLEHFQHLLSAARTAKREKVFRMSPSERSRIASLRNRLTPEELKSMDARTAMATVISRGGESRTDLWITMGKIKYQRPRAWGTLLVEGIETRHRLEFVQAEGVWKLDPACFDENLDEVIVRRASRTGVTEDSIIQDRETAASGKRTTDAIWDPPV